MSLIGLVLRQLRHRALASALTVAAVALGVALGVAVIVARHEAGEVFGQRDFGYDAVIGPKGSPLQLALAAIYQLERPTGTIPYPLYQRLLADPGYRPMVAAAVPLAMGDSVRGRRVIATGAAFFALDDDGAPLSEGRVIAPRPGAPASIAEGRVFRPGTLEAVVGAEVPVLAGLAVGDVFQASHGDGAGPADEHEERWSVVGRAARTGTAFDRAVFVPLDSFFAVPEHAAGLRAQAALASAAPADDLSPLGPAQWRLSAILVRSRGPFWASSLLYRVNSGAEASAINPAAVMREFVAAFLAPAARLLEALSALVVLVALLGVVVGISSALSARRREIAIMRALGATRRRIVAVICAEAACLGAAGVALGALAGHALGAVAARAAASRLGEALTWPSPSRDEWLLCAAVLVASALAGLAPAWQAYRADVASGLEE